MDWFLKFVTGGLVQVGDRSQFLAALTAFGAVVYAVGQYLTGTDMNLMVLASLIGEKWPVIMVGLFGYTMAAKVQRMVE